MFCVIVCARAFAMRYECSPCGLGRVIRSKELEGGRDVVVNSRPMCIVFMHGLNEPYLILDSRTHYT